MSRYLHHITLPSLHRRESYRSEASDTAVAFAADLLTRAQGGERVDLIGPAAHHGLSVKIDGHVMLATIDAPAGPYTRGDPNRGPTVPMLLMGVPRKARPGPGLWALMCTTAKMDTLPNAPSYPYLAALPLAPLPMFEEATDWLGDLERLLAWAWIES